MSYWSNRRICTANGGLPPAVKRKLYYDAAILHTVRKSLRELSLKFSTLLFLSVLTTAILPDTRILANLNSIIIKGLIYNVLKLWIVVEKYDGVFIPKHNDVVFTAEITIPIPQ